MQAFFNNGSRLGMDICYSFEEQPLGTAGPLSLIEGMDSTFLVANGDVLTTLDLKALVEAHQAWGCRHHRHPCPPGQGGPGSDPVRWYQ
jgi:NDP-sugar pyrophosphorylase family protein